MQHDKKDFSTIAGQGFLKIQEIFHIEGRNPEKPYEKSSYSIEEIAEIREKKSAVLVDNFFKWCEEKQGITLPKSLTGRAISYALSQKKSLCSFLRNPMLELTNNAAERAVRPVVMGRKNGFLQIRKQVQGLLLLFFPLLKPQKQISLNRINT